MTAPLSRLIRIWILLIGSLVAAGPLAGCAANALKQGQIADDMRDFDAAVAQYMKAVREHPTDHEAQLLLDRAKLRASNEHHMRGRRMYAQGHFDEALVELQLANELNPTNADAEKDLKSLRGALRAQVSRPEGGPTQLESLLATMRDAAPGGFDLPDVRLPAQITTGQQSTVRTVYLTIARIANVSVTFDSALRDAPAPVSLLSGMTVRQALDAVAKSTSTFYQVTGPNTIVVVQDTPAKRREYTEEVVRQFTLQNADVKETMDALRVAGDARYISPITAINAIVVRDTPERVQIIGRFISQFDKARPEVIVDVEVLEVSRNQLRDYGIQLASPSVGIGIDGQADINRPGMTLESLRNLSASDVMLTNIPALYYRLLKTDARTRTLANPHIRMMDGITSQANFGQRVPVPKLTITPIAQGGVNIQPQTQFDYQTIGVNLGITPRTHPNDDVTLGLSVELSSLGPPGFDGLPTFGQRSVTTTIRLKDGETNILAGLIREDERIDRQAVPGLGDIPVLGKMFGRTRREAEQTDVVVMLTPHIVRTLDLSADDLRPLRMPREGTGAAIIEPIVPAPPIRGGGGGGRH